MSSGKYIFSWSTMTRVVRQNYFFSSVRDRWRRLRLSVNCLQNFSRLRIFCLTKRGLVGMWRHVLVKIAIVPRESEIISAVASWRRSRSATSPVIQPEYRTIRYSVAPSLSLARENWNSKESLSQLTFFDFCFFAKLARFRLSAAFVN